MTPALRSYPHIGEGWPGRGRKSDQQGERYGRKADEDAVSLHADWGQDLGFIRVCHARRYGIGRMRVAELVLNCRCQG